MKTSPLTELFTERGKRELLARWPDRHLAVFGPVSRLPSFLSAPRGAISSLLTLAGGYRGAYQVASQGKDGYRQRRTEEQPPLAAYAKGMTIMLGDLGGQYEDAGRWLAALAEEVGTTPQRVRLNAWASPNGEGLPFHHDLLEVILVQLNGRKTVRVASNLDAPHPHQQYRPTARPSRELFVLYHQGFPERVPRRYTTIELEPGSVLFMPRGTWHATEGHDESFSVSITLEMPTALELMLTRLRIHLLQRPGWRRPLRQRVHLSDERARLAQLMAALPEAVGRFTPDELLALTSHQPSRAWTPDTCFQRAPNLGCRLTRVRSAESFELRWREPGPESATRRLPVPGPLLTTCRWIVARRPVFALRDLPVERGVRSESAGRFLRRLVDLGLLYQFPVPIPTSPLQQEKSH